MSELFSLAVEKYCLGGILKYPELFPEIDTWVKDETFFQSTHRVIWSVLKQTILKKETPTPTLIAQRISNLNIKTKDDLSIFDYLNAISYTQINKDGVKDSFKELVKLKVLRELVQSSQKVQEFISENKDKEIQAIISGVDAINNEKIVALYKSVDQEVKDLFSDIEGLVEGIASNPPDPNAFWFGPFPSINRMFGSLNKPSNITIIAARSGSGKSSICMFHQVYIAEKYNLPLLWLDFGEMTAEELMMRACCMMTNGQVPLFALETGEWRQNPEWAKLVRDVWQRVKKIKFYYQDVSNMGAKETISFVRRFAYNKVGRGNPFLVVYDYFKPFDTTDFKNPEWKQMGHFLQDIKSFIVNELPIPWWGAIQLNRSGITTNKKSDQIDDSENAIGLSDRITQQSSHALILRFKTMDELAVEDNRFGNMKLIAVKHRHLGKDFIDAIRPVKIGKRFLKNHVNIDGGSFFYEDKGDLKQVASVLKEQYELLEESKEETL